MKSAILYSTLNRDTAAQCPGVYASVYVPAYGYVYVRAELRECTPLECLDHAAPREGETFLNGIPLDDEARRAC